MKLETSYAQALLQVSATKPAAEALSNLRSALERRGHTKLLPKIYSECLKLQVHAKRLAVYTTPTKESERTRLLIDLYKKLITTS